MECTDFYIMINIIIDIINVIIIVHAILFFFSIKHQRMIGEGLAVVVIHSCGGYIKGDRGTSCFSVKCL